MSRLITRLLLAVILLLFDLVAAAAELTPLFDDGRLGARIQSLPLPETLSKELTSGLTNRLLIRVTLLDAGQAKAAAGIQIALKYDLWDERFECHLLVDEQPMSTPNLRTVDDVLRWLADLRLPRLFAAPQGERLVLKAEALLNPIDRERMERIRKWVKENSSYVPLDSNAGSVGSISGSNAVFNRIFEEYASGREYASAWSNAIVSQPFNSGSR